MKALTTTALLGFLVFIAGCDTPMAAAKRDREGITWEEWQRGIRTKEAKDEARGLERQAELDAIQRKMDGWKAYVAARPNLPPQVAQAIVRGELARGMDGEAVRLVWGNPASINKSVGSFGEHEQWVFSGGRYAYLRNGILDSWQEETR